MCLLVTFELHVDTKGWQSQKQQSLCAHFNPRELLSAQAACVSSVWRGSSRKSFNDPLLTLLKVPDYMNTLMFLTL